MVVYADLVVLLNFLVDLCLLAGTNRLAGYSVNWKRTALAAVIGGVYAGACLCPQLSFLGNILWRTVSLLTMSGVCFGWHISALRRGCLFVLLSMALGGVARGMGDGGIWTLLGSGVGIWFMCSFGFRGKAGQAQYVNVEIDFRGRRHCLTALRDTGNHLADPVTGKQVLIVGADLAWDLVGLTPSQLQNPVAVLEQGILPGLRLIPYRAVGKPTGMLLGIKVDRVLVAGQPAGEVIAFAPEVLSGEKAYQALTGGVL